MFCGTVISEPTEDSCRNRKMRIEKYFTSYLHSSILSEITMSIGRSNKFSFVISLGRYQMYSVACASERYWRKIKY